MLYSPPQYPNAFPLPKYLYPTLKFNIDNELQRMLHFGSWDLYCMETDIITVAELAQMLKMSKSQVYEQTRKRARLRQTKPLPYLRINGNLRFSRAAVDAWLKDKLRIK